MSWISMFKAKHKTPPTLVNSAVTVPPTQLNTSGLKHESRHDVPRNLTAQRRRAGFASEIPASHWPENCWGGGEIRQAMKGWIERWMRGLWTRTVTRPHGKRWTRPVTLPNMLGVKATQRFFVVPCAAQRVLLPGERPMTSSRLTAPLCETDKEGVGSNGWQREREGGKKTPSHQVSHGASRTYTYILTHFPLEYTWNS